MNKSQHDYLLNYLKDLEERIADKQNELKERSAYNGISVSSIATVASELACLHTEQRAICFTLRHMDYYVQYKDGHAEDIILETGE